MGTLASELGGHAERVSGQPRVYVDANVPAGLVAFMRQSLQWDVLFVLEHDELRRAPDGEHYRLARQLRRTLITQDRDYLDDRKFPPAAERRRAGAVGAGRKGADGCCSSASIAKCCAALPVKERRSCRRDRRTAAAARGPQASRAHRLGRRDNRTVIVVSGGDLILPGRVDQRRVADHRRRPHRGHRIPSRRASRGDDRRRSDCYVAPGFIDVHVHGLHGHDTLDGDGAVARIAALLPRYGVTAFCPTTVACAPEDLRGVLQQVAAARSYTSAGFRASAAGTPRKQFHQPGLQGAQPADCLRTRDRRPPRRRLFGSRRPRRDLCVPPGRRHRDDWRLNCQAASIWCARWRRLGIEFRSVIPDPTTTPRLPPSTPVRVTRRISSIA